LFIYSVSQKTLLIVLPMNLAAVILGAYATYNPAYIPLYGSVSILYSYLGFVIASSHIGSNEKVRIE